MGTAPFFGQAPAGVYFGAVPPGMDLAMMGMPPPFMGMMGQEFVADDYEEPLGCHTLCECIIDICMRRTGFCLSRDGAG